MIVLDTNVISEMMRPADQRSAMVMAWLGRQPGEQLYTTAISVAEIRSGLAMMPEGRRKASRQEAAERLLALFLGRILPFDLSSTRHFADMVARRRKSGQAVAGFDILIAAIAHANAMAVATRNTTDFADCGVDLINPWEA